MLKLNSCCLLWSPRDWLDKMTGVWRLDTLPSDVLILIFDYCHAFDLVRLSEVCTRFYDIIREETLWIKKSKQPIVTNQTSRQFRERYVRLCLRIFSVYNILFLTQFLVVIDDVILFAQFYVLQSS